LEHLELSVGEVSGVFGGISGTWFKNTLRGSLPSKGPTISVPFHLLDESRCSRVSNPHATL
jgi:hypothetical protein